MFLYFSIRGLWWLCRSTKIDLHSRWHNYPQPILVKQNSRISPGNHHLKSVHIWISPFFLRGNIWWDTWLIWVTHGHSQPRMKNSRQLNASMKKKQRPGARRNDAALRHDLSSGRLAMLKRQRDSSTYPSSTCNGHIRSYHSYIHIIYTYIHIIFKLCFILGPIVWQ